MIEHEQTPEEQEPNGYLIGYRIAGDPDDQFRAFGKAASLEEVPEVLEMMTNAGIEVIEERVFELTGEIEGEGSIDGSRLRADQS